MLGLAEKSTGLVLEGVPDAAQLRTVLWGQLNDRQFVVVNVPRAWRLQRPVLAA